VKGEDGCSILVAGLRKPSSTIPSVRMFSVTMSRDNRHLLCYLKPQGYHLPSFFERVMIARLERGRETRHTYGTLEQGGGDRYS